VITAEGVSEADLEELLDRVEEIEGRMHPTWPESEIAQINQAAGVKAVAVSNDTYEVIKKSLEMARASEGAFDPTLGPIIELWGISSDNPRLPAPEEIQEKLELVNYRNVILNDNKQTVYLTQKGMALDLGGIAKGYAADMVYGGLQEKGALRALIDFGGNIMTLGDKGDRPWRIGVQDPFVPRGTHMGILTAVDQTIVTSGIYERFLEVQGVQYHHILNSRTGYPVDNNLAGVTIRTNNSMEADGFSTALFALGPQKGAKLLEAYPHIEAYYITRDKEVIAQNADGSLQITNSEYTLK